MASQYKQADGHNIALGSLVLLNPQPQSHGVQAVTRSYGLSGEVHEQGLFIVLRYNSLPWLTYQLLLAQYGVATALTNAITLYVPNHQFAYTRYNGTVVRPENGVDLRRTSHFLQDVAFLVKSLVAPA